MFINGVKDATTYVYGGTISPASSIFRIGGVGDPIYMQGYLDELRITKGIARYTTNFTPDTNPFTYTDPRITTLVPYDVLNANPAMIVGSIGSNRIQDPKIAYLYYDGGTYSVTGTVLYNGQPASRKVGLFTLKDKRLIAETWSDPTTGVYTFTELKEQEYFVWSEDYVRVFDPVSHLVPNTAG